MYTRTWKDYFSNPFLFNGAGQFLRDSTFWQLFLELRSTNILELPMNSLKEEEYDSLLKNLRATKSDHCLQLATDQRRLESGETLSPDAKANIQNKIHYHDYLDAILNKMVSDIQQIRDDKFKKTEDQMSVSRTRQLEPALSTPKQVQETKNFEQTHQSTVDELHRLASKPTTTKDRLLELMQRDSAALQLINCQNSDGHTALHLAIRANNKPLVEALIECGARTDIFSNIKNPKNALMEAAAEGHVEIIKYLVLKCDVNAQNSAGATALHHAVHEHQLEAIRCLVNECNASLAVTNNNMGSPKERAKSEYKQLKAAADVVATARQKIICAFLETAEVRHSLSIASVPADANVDQRDADGNTALLRMLLMKNADLRQIQLLILQGASVYATNNRGHSALHLACGFSDNLAAVIYLLDKQARIALFDNSGLSPLDFAIMNDNLAAVIYLIEKYNAYGKKGPHLNTGLMQAVHKKKWNIVKYLVEVKKVPINEKNSIGATALHVAAKNCIEMYGYLVTHGADETIKNNQGFIAKEILSQKPTEEDKSAKPKKKTVSFAAPKPPKQSTDTEESVYSIHSNAGIGHHPIPEDDEPSITTHSTYSLYSNAGVGHHAFAEDNTSVPKTVASNQPPLSTYSIHSDAGNFKYPAVAGKVSDVFPAPVVEQTVAAPSNDTQIKQNETDYLRSDEAKTALQFVYDNFLSKPFNEKWRKLDEKIEKAWRDHAGWKPPQDYWSITVNKTEVPRPNYSLAATVRMCKLAQPLAEYLRIYSKDPKLQNLSQQEILIAQHMTVYSLIGRDNGWSEAEIDQYEQIHQEVYPALPLPKLDANFKSARRKGFNRYYNENPSAQFPFKNTTDRITWADRLENTNNTAVGELMFLAYCVDLMRYLPASSFSEVKKKIAEYLGGNIEATEAIVNYGRALIIATGDRCTGHGQVRSWDPADFKQASLDVKMCLIAVQNVPMPEIPKKSKSTQEHQSSEAKTAVKSVLAKSIGATLFAPEVEPKEEVTDYLQSVNGKKTVKHVFENFLSQPYNPALQKADPNVQAAWRKHKDWDGPEVMGFDWQLKTPSGIVPRHNHSLASTLRATRLVWVISKFLKVSNNKVFHNLSAKDILVAQHLMTFSLVGRGNEMGYVDSLHYQQAYAEAYSGKKTEHLYFTFKNKTRAEFINYTLANKADWIPSLFATEQDCYQAQKALDMDPADTSPICTLMKLAHDVELMRCYEKDKFKDKVEELVSALGGDREAATAILDYERELIKATGDRCIGYQDYRGYDYDLFGKVSLNYNTCLERIQRVKAPEPKQVILAKTISSPINQVKC